MNHAVISFLPLVDERPRTPSPGCQGSSSLPYPSFCQACKQRKQPAHTKSTRCRNIRSNRSLNLQTLSLCCSQLRPQSKEKEQQVLICAMSSVEVRLLHNWENWRGYTDKKRSFFYLDQPFKRPFALKNWEHESCDSSLTFTNSYPDAKDLSASCLNLNINKIIYIKWWHFYPKDKSG